MTSEAMEPEMVDRVHELLSDSRRRSLLYRLLYTDQVDVDNLSCELAARERGVPIEAVSERECQQVSISFAHNHLPQLVDYGVIEYNDGNGVATTAERFDEIRPFVEHAEPLEHSRHCVPTPAQPQTSGLSN
ncbi:hypothetical protein OB905_07590 [Halobacteria archaeon AArc-dxtr1]|nr:hypothetical protein [Halobacteria archaeon AArc-dxtr1]